MEKTRTTCEANYGHFSKKTSSKRKSLYVDLKEYRRILHYCQIYTPFLYFIAKELDVDRELFREVHLPSCRAI